MNIARLDKRAVSAYWNAQACGTEWANSARFTAEYFDEIERYRYAAEPMVKPFADFGSSVGKSVLEVGVGAGTDFVNWVRAGARAWGVDLTAEAIEHTRRRLLIEGLRADGVCQGDCEYLPYRNDTFDVVYSWGVIHHTPDTSRALREIVRVCRPGGTCKLMVYNRHSLLASYLWLRWALLEGRPHSSREMVIREHMESPGTRAFTRREVQELVSELPIDDLRIETHLSRDDRLLLVPNPVHRTIAGVLARLLGPRAGWFMTLEFTKRRSLIA